MHTPNVCGRHDTCLLTGSTFLYCLTHRPSHTIESCNVILNEGGPTHHHKFILDHNGAPATPAMPDGDGTSATPYTPSLTPANMLQFYPIFPFFSLTCPHTTYLCAPPCAFKSWDLSLLILHSRALSSSPMPLFGSLRLCYSFLSHSSNLFIYDSLVPFSTIHLPHLAGFLIPNPHFRYITFHLYQKPYASFP
jgi:hypothetical protein